MNDFDDDFDDEAGCDEPGYEMCAICGALMVWESCWQCFGDGGFHDCGECCCQCLDKEEITELCDECGGHGGYLVCAALPHTEEQVAAYREGKANGPD